MTKSICILGPAYPYKGGIAAFNERLAIELHNQGYQIEVVTFSLQYPSFLFPGKSQLTPEKKEFPFPISRKLNAFNPINWLFVGYKLRKKKYDLVISRFWLPIMALSMGTVLRIIKANKTSKITAIIDNLIPHESRVGDRVFTQYFLNSLDCSVAMSSSVKSDIRSVHDKIPIALTPHPIYDHYGVKIEKKLAQEKLNLDPKKKYLLFFGLVRKYKGLDLLLEALKILNSERKDISLVIAGEFYDDEGKYRKMISEYGLSENTIIKSGFIPDEEVATIFSASEMMVLPYRTATQSGISQMALHFDLPMVVTNVGGLPEVIEDKKTGSVCAPNPDSISVAILKTLDLDHNEFSRAIREKKSEYSWKTFSKNILDI